MALSDTVTKVVYAPDGAQVRFDIPFPLFDARDVECIAVDAAGAESPITAFSVVGMQSESGPAVVFDAPPAAGVTLVIRRYTRQVHETTYPEGGKFPSRVVELDFDRIVAMIQELNEVVDRSLKVNVGEESPPESAEELYSRIVQIAERAEAAVTEAAGSAAAADVSAGAAAGSASAAAASEVSAEYYMEMARKWAVNPEDVPVLAGLFSAYHWALKAREWASSGIILSDALDGERKAADGVGASEWALAQAYAKAGEAAQEAMEISEAIEANVAILQAQVAAIRTGAIPGDLLLAVTTAKTVDWTAPDVHGDGTDYVVEFELKGGGGGGAKAAGSYGGTGGAEGETVIGRKVVTPGRMYTGVVGAGGKGGTTGTSYNSDQDTANGASSVFDGITAAGGGRGNTTYLSIGLGGGQNLFSGNLIRIKGESSYPSHPYGGDSLTMGSKGAGKHGGRAGSSVASAVPIKNDPEPGLLGCGGGAGTASAQVGAKGGDGYLLIWRVR